MIPGNPCPTSAEGGRARVMRAISDLEERMVSGGRRHPLCAYVYDLGWLRVWAEGVMRRLPARCRLYYAVKANPAGEVLRALRPFVAGYEVASSGEIGKVRAAAADRPILFGGPGKTEDELASAIRSGLGHLHVESLLELHRVERIAASLGKRVPILLRINLRENLPAATLRMSGVPTQFGIDEDDLPRALEQAKSSRYAVFEGFHLHCLSNQLDAEAHAGIVRLYLRKAKAWSANAGLSVRVVNAGGGIGINYAEGGAQFDWGGFTARLGGILEAEMPDGWELRFECGRFLVAGCGFYAVEVLDIKKNHGKWFAIVRGGTHHFRLPASWGHSHPFLVLSRESWPHPYPRPVVRQAGISVCGQLCTPKDTLAKDAFVEELKVGDILLFRLAGAYGWTISHRDFLSHPHPEEVYLDPDRGSA